MRSEAATPEEYIESLPEDRKQLMHALRSAIRQHLPEGFAEVMQYGMISYVVPHSLYPPGYHTDPRQPLPWMSIASQKKHVAVYHMGLYSSPELLDWFQEACSRQGIAKLDMGKSCMRFTKTEEVPVALIGQLAGRMSPQQWIERYTQQLRQHKPRSGSEKK